VARLLNLVTHYSITKIVWNLKFKDLEFILYLELGIWDFFWVYYNSF